MRTPASTEDRKFMEIAIDEMCQSRSEHTNKFDPMVGAVIVDKRGKEVARGHRGNFSAGDHAEFTVLEKLASDKDPEGSTLYATLEPCTRRKPPKEPCAERIVKKRVGRVVIGITDPNPEIHGLGVKYLLDHGVKVEFFDVDLAQQIREENSDFIEYFDRMSEPPWKPKPFLTEKPEPVSYEERIPISNASFSDFSCEAIQEYLDARNLSFRAPSAKLENFFIKSGLLAVRPGEERTVPTAAGLLLFGEDPVCFLPHCKIKALCFSGTPDQGTDIDNLRVPAEDISGPLFHMVKDVGNFFLENVTYVPRIEAYKTVKAPEYPLEVLREVIVNALVHRDYSLAGMHIVFQMFRDRIVVKSPGALLKPLSLEKIRTYNVISLKRNPRIGEAFHHMNLMDELGFGIPRMPGLLRKHGLREPDFDYDGANFIVTLYGRERSPATLQISSEILAQLHQRQQKILDLIGQRRRTSSEECRKEFAVTRETVNQDFRKLIDLGLIERRGTGRSTYYVLRET